MLHTTTTLQPTGNPFWHDNSMYDNAVNVVFRAGTMRPLYFEIVEPTVTQTNNFDPLLRLVGRLPASTQRLDQRYAVRQAAAKDPQRGALV